MIPTTARERTLALGLIVALAGSALYGLAVKPARDRIQTLQRIVPEKQAQLRDLEAQSARYLALKRGFDDLRARVAAQDPDFQLLPFLESMIQRHKLADRLVAMAPDLLQPQPDYGEVVVTIELHGVSLKQLVDFLRDVGASQYVVRIGTLHIRKDPSNEALLDSTIGISSPTLGPASLTAQAPS
jgi:type II secretory pathway component PulM